jgi:hypothetical protein
MLSHACKRTDRRKCKARDVDFREFWKVFIQCQAQCARGLYTTRPAHARTTGGTARRNLKTTDLPLRLQTIEYVNTYSSLSQVRPQTSVSMPYRKCVRRQARAVGHGLTGAACS